jgi:hypothetical protein
VIRVTVPVDLALWKPAPLQPGRGRQSRVDFWLTTKDLPMPENRVTVDGEGNVHLAYTVTNESQADKLYVVDTSFFLCIGAALMAMANALRVGEPSPGAPRWRRGR